MRVFSEEEQNSTWAGSINFIDKNNCLIGYDLCEDGSTDAQWYVSSEINYEHDFDNKNKNIPDIESYSFDPTFFESVNSGNLAIFKLVCEDKVDLYLQVFDCKEGYHSNFKSSTL